MSDLVRPTTKQDLRAQLAATRATRSPAARREAGQRLVPRILELVQDGTSTGTVAAYVSTPVEPDTGPAIEALSRKGTSVLLPVLCADLDLDWAELTADGLRPGRFGISEPTGPLLGPAAIERVGVVLCPGLAGSFEGQRLGRGGGSYDRALARTRPPVVRALLLYDDELVDVVPTEPHDQSVDVIVTPERLVWASPARR